MRACVRACARARVCDRSSIFGNLRDTTVVWMSPSSSGIYPRLASIPFDANTRFRTVFIGVFTLLTVNTLGYVYSVIGVCFTGTVHD